MDKRYKLISLILLSSFVCSTQAQTKLPSGAAAIVNNVTITDVVVDEVVKANITRGQKDTPQLRKAVIDGLVNQELIAQDANKQGLDKTPEAKNRLNELRQNLLVELALAEYFQKNPITDQAVKAEYDRQIASLGDSSSLLEYKLAIILVPNESDIKSVGVALKKGESFAKLAQEKSIDLSKSEGGSLGWVLSNNLSPAVIAAIKGLTKNASLTTPIQVQNGWMIIKVEDRRSYSPPTLKDSQATIRNGLLQKAQANYIASLRATAKISE